MRLLRWQQRRFAGGIFSSIKEQLRKRFCWDGWAMRVSQPATRLAPHAANNIRPAAFIDEVMRTGAHGQPISWTDEHNICSGLRIDEPKHL